MADGRLDIVINGDNSGFKRSAKDTENSIQSLVGKAKNFAKAFGIAFVVRESVKAFSELTSAYKVQEQNLTKLNSINTAVGKSVGYTTEQLLKMAGELQQNSTFGDEMILNAQQTLLTVGNLTQDTFNRALQASADLASALGEDITGASQSLALALQDPEQGLRRLRTAGINFTDVEKAQIKTLKENGKEQEVQALILAKIEEKYSGIAKDIADTDTGKLTQIANTWGDIKEDLGGALLDTISPALDALYNRLQKLAGWVKEHKEETGFQRDLKEGNTANLTLEELNKYRDKYTEEIKKLAGRGTDASDAIIAEYERQISLIDKQIKKRQQLDKIEENAKKRAEAFRERDKDIIAQIEARNQKEADTKQNNLDVKNFLSENGINKEKEALQETRDEAVKLRAEMERLGTAFNADGTATDSFKELGAVIDDCDKKMSELAQKAGKTGNFLQKTIGDSTKTIAGALNDLGGAITDLIGSIYNFQNQQSQNTIDNLQAELDAHLEAGDITQEQEKELTREIQNEKRKQFEAEKKNSVAGALINGALAITRLWAENEWPVALAMSAIVGATTAMQVATINSQQFQGFERGGIVGGSGITGDNHPIFANAGELILTHAQQGAIAGQLENQSSPVISINFNGQVFGSQEEISRFVYDGIRTAQNEGVLRQW